MKTEKKAIILVGIQGSGKTTFCKRNLSGYVHISLDELHTRNKEKILLEECAGQGISFVVDNTNPTKAEREKYIRVAKENNYHVCGYYFRSSVAECIERNSRREGKARVPDCAIAGTHRKLELPEYREGFDELFYVHMEEGGFIVDSWNG